MKKLFYGGLVLLVLIVAVQPAVGQAQMAKTQFEVPFSGLPFVTCLGETVTCEGSILVTARQLIDASGAVHFTTQGRDLGVTCTGDDSGTNFLLNSTETEATRIDLPCEEEGCISFTNFISHFISPGSADNLIVNVWVRQLITPNGQMDVFEIGVVSQCTG